MKLDLNYPKWIRSSTTVTINSAISSSTAMKTRLWYKSIDAFLFCLLCMTHKNLKIFSKIIGYGVLPSGKNKEVWPGSCLGDCKEEGRDRWTDHDSLELPDRSSDDSQELQREKNRWECQVGGGYWAERGRHEATSWCEWWVPCQQRHSCHQRGLGESEVVHCIMITRVLEDWH